MAGARDPYDLERFVDAQRTTYDAALSELRDGRKTGHWMWYIFPQIEGLGRSRLAETYAISSLEEALAYIAHPLLGARLFECAQAAVQIPGGSAREVFGSPDDLKFRSSMTLFAAVSPEGSVFEAALERYFAGRGDEATLELLGSRPDRGFCEDCGDPIPEARRAASPGARRCVDCQTVYDVRLRS